MFIVHALSMAFAMFWEILWALILGFALSGIVQAVVSKREMTRLLPNDSPRTLTIACGLGAASSSCSYAAVALARSIFRKGANFTAATVFQLASTNLVIELGIIMIILLGWQFALAEFVGAPLMVVILTLLCSSMAAAELGGELLFKALGWIPSERHATITEAQIAGNYTTVLNIVFLGVAGVLVWRAATSGGFRMLRMMNRAPHPSAASHKHHPRHVH
jgi:hypothetical protein